jgi:hypothetical protein
MDSLRRTGTIYGERGYQYPAWIYRKAAYLVDHAIIALWCAPESGPVEYNHVNHPVDCGRLAGI